MCLFHPSGHKQGSESNGNETVVIEFCKPYSATDRLSRLPLTELLISVSEGSVVVTCVYTFRSLSINKNTKIMDIAI